MADESSLPTRVLSGALLGALVTGGFSAADATPTQRVALPAGIGLLLALLLPEERDLGVGVVLGAVATSSVLSSVNGQPALEFLPEGLRPGGGEDRSYGQTGERERARRRREELNARANRLLAS